MIEDIYSNVDVQGACKMNVDRMEEAFILTGAAPERKSGRTQRMIER
jgi:hypothetical protein